MMSLSRDFRSKLVSIDRHVRDLFGPRLQSHNLPLLKIQSSLDESFCFPFLFRSLLILAWFPPFLGFGLSSSVPAFFSFSYSSLAHSLTHSPHETFLTT